MKGLINRLLAHSFVDGPGNRAVLFVQGCPLHCLYCHNPQTQVDCNGCQACVAGCPGGALSCGSAGQVPAWDVALCQGCDTCIEVCPNRSDPRAIWYEPGELMTWLEPYIPFISGVTITGGEPLAQAEFTGELCRLVRERGRSSMVETSAAFDFSAFSPVLPFLDGALVDLKVWDEQRHRELTGVGNEQVKANLRRLAHLGKLTEVRVPVIPGFSDSVENMAATAAFVAELDPAVPLRLQRFRAHGTVGVARGWASPSDERMDQLAAVARAAGLKTVSRSL